MGALRKDQRGLVCVKCRDPARRRTHSFMKLPTLARDATRGLHPCHRALGHSRLVASLPFPGYPRSPSRPMGYFSGVPIAFTGLYGPDGYVSGITFTCVVTFNGYLPPVGYVSSTKYAA